MNYRNFEVLEVTDTSRKLKEFRAAWAKESALLMRWVDKKLSSRIPALRRPLDVAVPPGRARLVALP